MSLCSHCRKRAQGQTDMRFFLEEKIWSTYAQILLRGTKSDVLISSILAATMKSFMLKPPACKRKLV